MDGFPVTIRSKVLDQDFFFYEDGSAVFDKTFVTYSSKEMRLIKGLPHEFIKKIHMVKEIFEGIEISEVNK